MEPYRQGIGRENLARGAASFVPGVGTAVNWGQMGPWERALSVGLDAADLLTLGGGKALTASLRGLMNLAKYNPFDPKMISFRGGLPRMDEAGNYLPSTNWQTMQPEAGVSVYQGAQFPFSRGTVIRTAPDIDVPFKKPEWKEWAHTNPKEGMEEVFRQRSRDMHRIRGNVMPGVRGSDLEALVNPETITASGVTHMPFSDFLRLPKPNSFQWPFSGLPYASESMANRALNLFSKYDLAGTIKPNAIDQWLAQARLASTIPATVPARGVNYTWNTPGIFGGAAPQRPYQTPFNLEEQYLRQAVRRGGWSPGG